MRALRLRTRRNDTGDERVKTRGQSMTELALVLPVLVLLLSIIEGGFAINAWIRVNSAARDATRFAMDPDAPTRPVPSS